jgi:hypothetical protein
MPPEYVTLAVVAIVFLGSLTRATFGFGDALVAMPLLALVLNDVRLATPLIALSSITISIAVLIQDWQHVQLKSVGWLIASSLVGIPIGVLFLTRANEAYVKGALALMILAFSTFALSGRGKMKLSSDRPAVLFGFCAGMLAGAYNAPGPPLVVFATLRQWPADRFRATLQGYFLFSSTAVLAVHGAAGLWNATVFRYCLWSFPLILVALVLGHRLNRRIDYHRFSRLVHGFLIVIAVALLIEVLWR